MHDVPALALHRGMDVLAWNRGSTALLVDFATLPAVERNLIRLTFLSDALTSLHTDWPRAAAAAGFWTRAQNFFGQAGITVQRVLTDNGSCYRSRTWSNTLADAGITHKRTRPCRPQTNGKVERFNRTLLDEWAYAKLYPSEQERRAAFPGWLHGYNHHRRHTALKGLPPASRVPNLSGQYT